MPRDHYDDGDTKNNAEPKKRFREYECPECTANNPMDDGIYEGDEVHCFYCGIPLLAAVHDGRLKMKTV